MLTLNERTVTLKLRRIEVCDLLLICAYYSQTADKWKILHDKLREQLDKFDESLNPDPLTQKGEKI